MVKNSLNKFESDPVPCMKDNYSENKNENNNTVIDIAHLQWDSVRFRVPYQS